MAKPWLFLGAVAPLVCGPPLRAQLKPETTRAFECYVRSAEERMARRPPLAVAELRSISTEPGSGPNPHKIPGAMIYDWIGRIFVPGATVERTVQMLQDYNHRPQYFPEIISAAKLLCRSGAERFGFSMRLKEPAVIDSDNDVVWERVDAHHWRCRSYSTKVTEIGKQHGYLYRLNSYWRFAENERGTVIEGETITLSGEFGSLMRTLGSLAGINPEKSLRKTLASIRETLEKPGLQFAKPPDDLPGCGEPVRPPGCSAQP
jgi:hypothetical protein